MSKRTVTKTNAPYRLKKHGQTGMWYAIDKKTRKQTSLKCKGTRQQANEIADIQFGNTDDSNAMHHMKAAEAHLMKCNPEWVTNTWDMIAKRKIKGPRGRVGGAKKSGTTAAQTSAWNNECWDDLRHKRCIDTTPRDFELATEKVGPYLIAIGKQIHNYAADHRLIPYPIMGKEMWPKRDGGKMSRTVTEEDHLKIVDYIGDENIGSYHQFARRHPSSTRKQWRDEWVNWLWFLWWTGASQKDAANIKAENVKWDQRVIEYKRAKWVKPEKHAPCRVAISKDGSLDRLLKKLPKEGYLFPLLQGVSTASRSRAFKVFVDWVKIDPVTPHGYRFAFAERAKEMGMSAEDRMTTLGHKEFLQTSHYDQEAQVIPASIEIIEGGLKAA